MWRLLSCCCHLRMVLSRANQMLMLPTSTHPPAWMLRSCSVRIRSCSSSLIRRGLYWSSRAIGIILKQETKKCNMLMMKPPPKKDKSAYVRKPFNLLQIEFSRSVCYSFLHAKSEKENLNESTDNTENCQLKISVLLQTQQGSCNTTHQVSLPLWTMFSSTLK